MKKILLVLIFFTCKLSYAQYDSTKPVQETGGYYGFATVAPKYTLSLPKDTLRLRIKDTGSIAFKNGEIFVYRYTHWEKIGSAIAYNEYGIKSGGEVRRLTGSNYEVTTVYYTIEGVNYVAVTDTVTLNTYADSAQVAGIFANTAQVISVRYGAKSTQPQFPQYVSTEDVLVAYVLISDTGNYIYTPSVDSNWVRDGDNLLNANPGNVILNDIYFIDGGAQKRIFSASSQLWLQSNRTTGSKILLGTVGGNSSVSTNEVEISGGDNSGTSGTKSALTISGRLLNASGTEVYSFINSAPTINKTGGTGDISFIKYNPTLTSVTGNHYFLNSSAGLVKFGGTPSVSDTTDKPVVMDGSGNLKRLSFWPIGSGGGGGSDDLAAVTARGATTSTPTQFGGGLTSNGVFTAADALFTGPAQFINSPAITNGNGLRYERSAPSGSVDVLQDNITGSRTHQLPDKDGTYAMTADIAQFFDDSSTVFIADSPLVVTLTETPGARDTVRITMNEANIASSGTFTPTATVDANVDDATPTKAFYTRIGNIVSVHGRIEFTSGLISNGVGEFNIDLPIPSAIGGDDLSGIANLVFTSGSFQYPVTISASGGTVTFTVETKVDNEPGILYYSYSYEIL